MSAVAEYELVPIPTNSYNDGTSSFYTKGTDGQIVEIIHYPEDFDSGVA